MTTIHMTGITMHLKLSEVVPPDGSFKKLKDYLFAVDDVIALQSSYYYTTAQKELGFYTIAQHNERYRKKIAELIEEFSAIVNQETAITILELGGGTGKFSAYMTKYLLAKGIKFEYTIVDVSIAQYSEELRNTKGLKLVESSFTEFALKNNKRYDILIMNEALDMWAGKQEVVDEWTKEEQPYEPYWVLIDTEKKKLVKYKDTKKIAEQAETNYVWYQVYLDKDSELIVTDKKPETLLKTRLPGSFKSLIQQINLFAVIQDYWSFEEQENTIRMGLYDGSVEKTLKLVERIAEEDKKELTEKWTEQLKQTTGVRSWIKSTVIPLGKVDVTYSPDQSELLDLSLELGLELMKNYSEDRETYDTEVFKVGEQDNEIFTLFTPKALDLRFEKR